MFVKAKSVPDAVDNVEHVIASLPVTVKLIDADDDVAAVRAKVTVGAVVSGNVVVVVVSMLPELLLGATVVVTDYFQSPQAYFSLSDDSKSTFTCLKLDNASTPLRLA